MTSTRQPFVVFSIDGLRELVAWVIAGATAEQREQRGEFAKKCLAEALTGADHDEMNRQIRAALQPDPFATQIPPATAAWRN